MLRFVPIALVGLAPFLLPLPAQAAESFVGVTESGSLVTFTADAPRSLSRPVAVRGLAPGERVAALDRGRDGVVHAVGTSARLYRLEPGSGQATPVGSPFAEGLRGSRFSLAVAPAGDRARLVSDVGQDLLLDLATGASAPGPGLRGEDGDPVRPAVDYAPDGRLVGVSLEPGRLLEETRPGSSVMAARPYRSSALGEPTAVQLASDGTAYLLAVLADARRRRQSVLAQPAEALTRTRGPEEYAFFARRLVTFAALGPVPRDRTAPRARVRLGRVVSAAALRRGRLPLRVTTSEGGQTTVSVRIGERQVGFGTLNPDVPGTYRLRAVTPLAGGRELLRRPAGRRVRIVVVVRDGSGNKRTVSIDRRLVR